MSLEASTNPHGSGRTPEGLNPEEIKIITSTIDLRDQTVDKIMVKIGDVFKLNHGEVLNEKLIKRIAKYGFSRIPIFDNDNNCVGILWAKYLLDFGRFNEKTIRASGVKLVPPLLMASHTNLLEALSIMEQRRVSVALISDTDGGAPQTSRRMSITSRNDKILSGNFRFNILGLITLKDIFERLVERDFEDHDQHLRSMMSYTYLNEKRSAQNLHEGGAKLVEMDDPEEYSNTKAPLLKHEVR